MKPQHELMLRGQDRHFGDEIVQLELQVLTLEQQKKVLDSRAKGAESVDQWIREFSEAK